MAVNILILLVSLLAIVIGLIINFAGMMSDDPTSGKAYATKGSIIAGLGVIVFIASLGIWIID